MKILKVVLLLVFLVAMSFNTVNSQSIQDEIIGVWERLPETEKYYKVYLKNGVCYDIFKYDDGEIIVDKRIYGFYDNCEPPHKDSLRNYGSGEYFFEIVDEGTAIEDNGRFIENRIDCWAISIDHDRDKSEYVPDSLYLHFERRAILEYKKIYELPTQLVDYLKKEQLDLYKAYCDLRKTNH